MKLSKLVPLVALLLFTSGCMSGSDGTGTQSTGDDVASDQPTTTLKASPRQEKPAGTPTTTVAQKGEAPTTTQKAAGLSDKLSDMAAAITSGIGYKCTYLYQNVRTEAWIKGQKFYSESTVDDKGAHVLSDGVWMYVWAEGQKTGTKFNIEEMKAASQAGSGQKPSDPGAIAKTAVSVECVPDLTVDSKFVVPSDVKFEDMAELLKQMQAYQGGGQLPNVPDLGGDNGLQ